MLKIRISAITLLIFGLFVGFFVYNSQANPESRFPFKLGLDLSGGTHLVYRADTSLIEQNEIKNSMEALRDVIDRRVNLFGVAEPLVQVETTMGIFSESKENRLIVELPGITDVDRAIEMIGKTPFLEFKLERPDGPEKDAIQARFDNEYLAQRDQSGQAQENLIITLEDGTTLNTQQLPPSAHQALYMETELTGRYLKKATLVFDSLTGQAQILLSFNSEGSKLFADITRENVGKVLAIYLDGAPISTPTIQQEIIGGEAEITGNFTPIEARELVGRLNSGALPVPIELLSSQTIGASLGEDAKASGVKAGIIGLIFVAVFLALWYRLLGIVAIVSLSIYIVSMLALFKLIPVTLTAAGIAGFILSIGMAVDANVLIFERIKEELKKGEDLRDAIEQGFKRAWLAIRDSNISSIITAVILFWFGTSLIQGFALVFGIGVLVSMLTAISVTRTFLLAISNLSGQEEGPHSISRALFGSGIKSVHKVKSP